MAGKRKKTKWRQLHLGNVNESIKEKKRSNSCEDSSSQHSSASSPPVSDEYSGVEVTSGQSEAGWTSHQPQSYCTAYQMLSDAIVDVDSPYQWQGQTYYPVYIPTLVPRIENVHHRIPTEFQYYCGLTYPPTHSYGAFHAEDAVCNVSNDGCDKTNEISNNAQESANLSNSENERRTKSVTGLGYCSTSRSIDRIPDKKQKRQKDKPKKCQTNIDQYCKTEQLERSENRSCHKIRQIKKNSSKVVEAGNKETCAESLQTSDGHQIRTDCSGLIERQIETDACIEIFTPLGDNSQDNSRESVDKSFTSVSIPGMKGEEFNGTKISPGVICEVDTMVGDIVACPETNSTPSIREIVTLEDWLQGFMAETLEIAKKEYVSKKRRKVSAIAERRGQSVMPIILAEQHATTSRRPKSKKLTSISTHHYFDHISCTILEDAIGYVTKFSRKKLIKKQKRFDSDTDSSSIPLVEKLANVLMYQILFDAQNQVIKMTKNKKIDQKEDIKVPIKGIGDSGEYKDTIMQLRREEEITVSLVHEDEFRKNNDEIVVYEASEGSECGSEDVEILAHRYDKCPAEKHSLRISKSNQLSLATEMLRTDQNLPYDAQFKPLLSPSDENGYKLPNNGETPNSSFILQKYYESLAGSLQSDGQNQLGKLKTEPKKGDQIQPTIHAEDDPSTQATKDPWWKISFRQKRNPGIQFINARDNPFPTEFCCNIL